MPRVMITIGDPAGIGPEVVDAALATEKYPLDCAIEICGDRSAGVPGKPDERSAAAALSALEAAVAALRDGRADAVVTGPVCKESLNKIGFPYPGQTEYFADAFKVEDYAMLLTGATLTVALATIHEPIAAVSKLLTEDRIVRCGRLTVGFLQQKGIAVPRIAVAGLNPHAGEGGVFGDEEQRVIVPAVRRLRETGDAVVEGPCVPDAVFREAAIGGYDAVIAMYHDQGLIPLKLLDFDTAVNVTLGLPKPRVSPDHGTAFGIAGKGIANPSSMMAAIRLACQLARLPR